MDKFGADGYLVFFGILEIYSREFKPELNWNLSVTRAYLRQKLHKRQDTIIIKCLEHIGTYGRTLDLKAKLTANSQQTRDKLTANSQQTRDKLTTNSEKVYKNSGKWDITFKDNQVIIFIPKFLQIIDDWTGRKLRSGSVVAPKNRSVIKKKEVRSKNKDIYSQNSDEFRLSKLLYDLILERNLKQKKPNLQAWSRHIDLTIRIDKRTPKEIENVIMWSQKDSFWQNNILSTEKMRKQFDVIWLKMNHNEFSDDSYVDIYSDKDD